MKDPYEILGVNPSADEDVIRAAYRASAKKHHPDNEGDIKKFKQVQSAYEKIKNGDTGDLPPNWATQRRKVLERDGYRCQNCGELGGPHGNVRLEVHHIVPRRNGGTHKIGNLRTLCKDCHNAITYDRNAPTATGFHKETAEQNSNTKGDQSTNIDSKTQLGFAEKVSNLWVAILLIFTLPGMVIADALSISLGFITYLLITFITAAILTIIDNFIS